MEFKEKGNQSWKWNRRDGTLEDEVEKRGEDGSREQEEINDKRNKGDGSREFKKIMKNAETE